MRRLIDVEQAKQILSDVKIDWDVRRLPVHLAIGRVVAETVYSAINIPPFRRSTRDGFAVMSDDVSRADEQNPVLLRIAGKIEAGTFPSVKLEPGKAIEIATGAVVPENADAVVMVEDTAVRDGVVYVKKPVRPNENVMQEGSDVVVGETLVSSGEILDTLKAGLVAGAGIDEVSVREMKIGIISTGDELLLPGEPIEPGKIYDVNSFTLYSELKKLGATPVFFGIAGDSEGEMLDKLKKALKECHAVITSGSTSAGKGDILYRVVEVYGEMIFHGVRIKPGKPFFFGIMDKKPVFGLPGFPTSCLTIFMEFVADVIARNLGYRLEKTVTKGKLVKRIFSEGRRELMPVIVVRNRIFPVEKGSGAITSLSEASGYIEIEEGEEIIERGSEREVTVFGTIHDIAVGGLDVSELVSWSGKVKRLITDPELARLEFSRENLDAVFYLDDSYFIPYGFFGEDGRTGAVKGYGIKADVYAKSHQQLLNMIELGAVDGGYFLEPFASKLGIEVQIIGELGIGFEAVREFERIIGDHLKRFKK